MPVIEITVAYYLGIDGGGSKTTCAVGDEVLLLGSAVTGPSNIIRVGEARARESLHEAIRQACAAAKIDPRQVHRACVGVAGVASEEVANTIRGLITEIVPAEIEVVGDMQIALQAALGADSGVVVIAGTGSIAYGRDAQGRTARAGGWGFAISDEGSAHWIGRTAVAALLRAADESGDNRVDQRSRFFHEVKSIWKVESLDQLTRTANTNPDFAALLPAVVTAADAGDEVARKVLSQAGRELADLAAIVVRSLFPEGIACGHATIPLALVGGVFRYALRVREIFCETLRQLDPRLEVNRNVVEPVAGALQIARKLTSRPQSLVE
ncbi:MAG: BadF/BadG/BcrA/BcrD ATPase family protein [Candidatus Sulfotelmatobacter sp.]|jgi:glucosamine kinase